MTHTQVFVSFCAWFGLGLSVADALSAPASSHKRLIEFGWDEPDAAFMRAHITEMEKTPFDGTVFHLNQDFLWQGWGRRAFTEAELKQPIVDFQTTPAKRVTQNFLRFNVTPGEVERF